MTRQIQEPNWLGYISHKHPRLEIEMDTNAAPDSSRLLRWRKPAYTGQVFDEWQYGNSLPSDGDSHE